MLRIMTYLGRPLVPACVLLTMFLMLGCVPSRVKIAEPENVPRIKTALRQQAPKITARVNKFLGEFAEELDDEGKVNPFVLGLKANDMANDIIIIIEEEPEAIMDGVTDTP